MRKFSHRGEKIGKTNKTYIFLLRDNMGSKKKIPINDIISPPIVPAANGNQKDSLSVPIMKGINPRMVDTTVRKIGITLAFHALT